MKKFLKAASVIAMVAVLVFSNTVAVFSSTTDESEEASQVVHGDYGVTHVLKNYKSTSMSYVRWRAKCDHSATNLDSFGWYCYCRLRQEYHGTIYQDTYRSYAYRVGTNRFHSETDYLDGDWYMHSYCGTEPH